MNGEPEEVDAEVVGKDEGPQSPAPEPIASREVSVRPPGREVLMPMDTKQVVAGMRAYQQLLGELLEPSDWQETREGKFPKKSAWRKISRAFNLSTQLIEVVVERDDKGAPLRAQAIVRAIAPNGQISDGDGYCAATEPRFDRASGRQKLENDLRTTATTRAKNRAISDLVGMGQVSAEEIEADVGAASFPEADKALKKELGDELTWLLPQADAKLVWGEIKAYFGNTLPEPLARAVIVVVKARRLAEETPPPPDDGKDKA